MVLGLITLAIVCVASLFGCIYLFCMADNESTKGIRGEKDYSAVSFLSGAAIIICFASLLSEGS